MKALILTVLFILLLGMGVITWRVFNIGDNVPYLSFDISTEPNISEQGYEKSTRHDSSNASNKNKMNEVLDSDITKTIARIKQDVVVTGTTTGTPGRELAFFQIEDSLTMVLPINAQLMDGFIIKEIDSKQVLLKNQNGNEIIVLEVDGGSNELVSNNIEQLTDIIDDNQANEEPQTLTSNEMNANDVWPTQGALGDTENTTDLSESSQEMNTNAELPPKVSLGDTEITTDLSESSQEMNTNAELPPKVSLGDTQDMNTIPGAYNNPK